MYRFPTVPAAAPVVASLLVSAIGCGSSTLPQATQTATKVPSVIVDSDWLAGRLNRDDIVVIDARNSTEYHTGHIAGAVNLTPQELLDQDPNNNKNMAPVAVIQDRLGAVGVDMNRTVVVYDDSNFRGAARLFWVLEVHGHPSVAVLRGGLAAWKRRQLPISDEPGWSEPTSFVAQMRPDRLATQLSVLRAIDSNDTAIVDARSIDEYRGVVSQAKRKGHIESAVSVDFENNLEFDGDNGCHLRYSDELKNLYSRELRGAQQVISYCNSGNRASVTYLTLRSLGYHAAVYDGSWLEWGNDPSLPIESEVQ